MFIALGILLLLAWMLGFVVFHVSSWLIHVLILVAIISFIVHFVTGKKAST
jgi:Family of unknown function (DUF5670)